jgi:RNA polymerase sigma-70 factor (ECF subfamily)
VDLNTLHSKACKGDRRAEEGLFEVLTSRFRLFVHQKVRNQADAEEIVQEALMTIYAEYGSMTFTASFAAWACKVLDNRILDYLRRKQRESARFDTGSEDRPDSAVTAAKETPDLRRQLLNCLQKICRRNIRYARILNLHYLGYKTGEICGRMSVKPETLYSALSKARSMLVHCLEKGEIK